MLNGWKTVLGYIVVSLVQALHEGSPMVAEALKKATTAPDLGNLLEAIGQVLLLVGVAHRVEKNIKK